MTDPIADLLTRLRNGIAAKHHVVKAPASRIKEALLKILVEEGYIESYIREEQEPQDILKIFLKYDADKNATVRRIARVSKPGRRVYRGYREIKPYLRGMGVRVLSTPKGIMLDHVAKKNKVGGEVLCEIW